MAKHYTIALAGNPNAGKSTIFNALTGAHQHVGNWPGKTVEKKEGTAHIGGHDVVVVDLPGAYSLTAYSAEEAISRDFIVHQHPDAVVAVVDATNLERNLYMVVQMIETGAPVVLALNMIDLAEAQGIRIDRKALSTGLGGIPVVPTAARQGTGMDALRRAILQVSSTAPNHRGSPAWIDYGPEVEAAIKTLETLIRQRPALREAYPPRWLAIKLLEGDADILALPDVVQDQALLEALDEAAGRIKAAAGEDPETLIVDRRYAFISDLVRRTVSRPSVEAITLSERIDSVLTNRWLGVPIFLLMMWTVFQMVANVSAPLLDWVDGVISGPITHWVVALLRLVGLGGTWVESLMVNGIISGVGSMLVFIPVLVILFLAIALLEDTGYMARAAFVMDRFMHLVGLHGKSFLPLLVGFGCNVPAIYATRTLESEADRRLTAFLSTFMSCGARLPVYVIFGSAFFGAAAGNLVFAMYMVGIGVAILTGFLLRRTVFRNKPTPPFMMELPPYRLPTLKGIWLHIWERTAKFVEGVTTTILLMSVIIWVLLAIPVRGGTFDTVPPGDSLFGELSRVLSPIFAPAGFGQWQATGALVSGVVAKEVVVTTLSQVYVGTAHAPIPEALPPLREDLADIVRSAGEALILTGQEIVNIVPRTVNILPGVQMPEAHFLGEEGESEDSTALESALRRSFTPLSAVAFNVFVLLYIPCVSTVAAMRQEFGPRWTFFQAGYSLLVAWIVAVTIYQGGLLLGLG